METCVEEHLGETALVLLDVPIMEQGPGTSIICLPATDSLNTTTFFHDPDVPCVSS